MSDPEQQSKEEKTVVRPQICPFCGTDLSLVRRVMGRIYEVDCQQCNVSAIIHSGDQLALPRADHD